MLQRPLNGGDSRMGDPGLLQDLSSRLVLPSDQSRVILNQTESIESLNPTDQSNILHDNSIEERQSEQNHSQKSRKSDPYNKVYLTEAEEGDEAD